ncbi:hypothetical protein ABIE65_001391 [Constrictibacter sp. MBR-5]|jgi:hypothetical protein
MLSMVRRDMRAVVIPPGPSKTHPDKHLPSLTGQYAGTDSKRIFAGLSNPLSMLPPGKRSAAGWSPAATSKTARMQNYNAPKNTKGRRSRQRHRGQP